MFSKIRIAMAVAASAVVLAATSGGAAATPRQLTQPPRVVTGEVIQGGADGKPHELLCPPEENVYGGGFSVTPGENRRLDWQSTDVLESRPNDAATGWIVSVRKYDCPPEGAKGAHRPANLTLRVLCTEGASTPNG
ncbi:hypothetical protein [Kitasatospora sp. HPMI-4]|uniref:hypothetical protein n=1 Tax=Kitasatospora sp. HPMI-4 TaxID=3448443 RepID=UPI003F1B44A5